MSLRDRLKPILKVLKTASLWGSGGFFVAYHIRQTCKSIDSIVNTRVLESEKKQTAEYIYIDDPTYTLTLKMEQDRQSRQSVGLARIWKSLKHSLAWKLLWLCRHGNKEQRNIALEQLAAFKNNKSWDCLKLAQALDKNTAVLLARTRGADLRYFLPPPIHVRRAALTTELLSFKLKDIIVAAQSVNPHSCIQHFLSKYFTNVQEQAMEADSIPIKPDRITERDLCLLCLDALHHHISLFHTKEYNDDISAKTVINLGLLPKLAELMLRYRNDVELDMAILRIFTVLSVHSGLLTDFFQNGLIGELSRLLRSKDVRLSSSAAVCLANLSGEYCYRPGLYLLHPIYRTTTPPSCDTLLVHGLRGGVFVTWRQRDRKCAEPIGIIDVTISDIDCDPCEEKGTDKNKYLDPDLQQVMEDLIELEDEALLSEVEVVLHDLPIEAKREKAGSYDYAANKKRLALIQEEQDRCNYTFCWPKDWLPKDCDNLRIMGVNYWSTLSEWLERCPLQTADIAVRAADLAPALIDAGVGSKNTPVVWLTHSMGGLIAKQVLIESAQSKDPESQNLSINTKAIFFYSTPHKGSSLATMPRAAAAVLWPSSDVRQLQVNSPVLLDLHNTFIKFADMFGWETISFAETMPTLVTAFKVPIRFVESVSADLGRGAFYQLPLDHLSICKPATRQSVLYTTLLEVIQKVTANDVEMVSYSNPFVQYLVELLWRLLRSKAKRMLDTFDDTQSNEGLRWFEQILLESFTDDFTD
ncbi:protein SERAC1 [Galleria mellonella]|uniref:Protein SERAC1 n=1 Tax=Galleria mellonella TaxID=7137 RepID=A0A6J1WWU1_GALME|nr:protein SERAC1 [Galleria mellonella]